MNDVCIQYEQFSHWGEYQHTPQPHSPANRLVTPLLAAPKQHNYARLSQKCPNFLCRCRTTLSSCCLVSLPIGPSGVTGDRSPLPDISLPVPWSFADLHQLSPDNQQCELNHVGLQPNEEKRSTQFPGNYVSQSCLFFFPFLV